MKRYGLILWIHMSVCNANVVYNFSSFNNSFQIAGIFTVALMNSKCCSFVQCRFTKRPRKKTHAFYPHSAQGYIFKIQLYPYYFSSIRKLLIFFCSLLFYLMPDYCFEVTMPHFLGSEK